MKYLKLPKYLSINYGAHSRVLCNYKKKKTRKSSMKLYGVISREIISNEKKESAKEHILYLTFCVRKKGK